MTDQRDHLPSRAWYSVGIVLMLLGLYAWWPMFTLMGHNQYLKVSNWGLAVAQDSPPLTFKTQFAGTYSIFTPGAQSDQTCEVQDASGEPVELRPAPRGNILVNDDTSTRKWMASFAGEAGGQYTLVCDGYSVGEGEVEVHKEPGSRRVYFALELAALWTGLLAGSAIIGVTAIRRHRRR